MEISTIFPIRKGVILEISCIDKEHIIIEYCTHRVLTILIKLVSESRPRTGSQGTKQIAQYRLSPQIGPEQKIC